VLAEVCALRAQNETLLARQAHVESTLDKVLAEVCTTGLEKSMLGLLPFHDRAGTSAGAGGAGGTEGEDKIVAEATNMSPRSSPGGAHARIESPRSGGPGGSVLAAAGPAEEAQESQHAEEEEEEEEDPYYAQQRTAA
jgi:hypothetical protein